MRPSLWASSCLLVLALGAPAPVRAWTDASVRSARARVVLEDGIRVRVTMQVEVRVDGGWLEAFELDGLDPGLALDEATPPVFSRVLSPERDHHETEDAAELAPTRLEPLSPRVSSHERGRIGFSFPRRSAPRRGDYVVEVTYVAPLAAAPTAHEAGSLLGWTFPAWRFGLDGVEVDLVLPAGSILDPAFREAAEGDAGILIEDRATEDGSVSLHLVRHHLPRTRSWPLSFVVPASVAPVVTGETEGTAAPPTPAVRAPVEPRPVPAGGLALALFLFALVLAKSSVVAREDQLSGRARPWRVFARSALAMAALAATFLSAWLWPGHAPLGIALLALAGLHGPAPSTEPRAGAFRPASSAWIRAARAAHARSRRGMPAWTRLGSRRGQLLVLGVALGTGIATALRPDVLPFELAALFTSATVAVLASGARSLREQSPLVSLGALLDAASRLRLPAELPALSLQPVVFVETGGRVSEARVRVSLASPPPGLVRLDLALGPDGELHVVAAARSGTDAARELARLGPLETASRERVGLILAAGDDPGLALGTIAEALTPQAAPVKEELRPAA